MNSADLEAVYEALARRIDAVGEEKSELYLAKLALLLAHRIGDKDAALEAIEQAAEALEG